SCVLSTWNGPAPRQVGRDGSPVGGCASSAAEHHKKSRMPGDRRPGGQRPGDRLRAAEDMRQKGQRGSEAVIARLVDKTARGGEKPPQLPARLVKMTGRRPALRAAHYCRGAVFAPHAPKLASDEF